MIGREGYDILALRTFPQLVEINLAAANTEVAADEEFGPIQLGNLL